MLTSHPVTSNHRRPSSGFAFLLTAVLLVLAALGACSATQFSLPPVATVTDGQRHPGSFIWHDLISDNPAGSQAFYSALFHWEFRPLPVSGASYWLITLDGQPLGGMVDQGDIAATEDISQWISAISVSDAAAAMAQVRRDGGSVLREPVAVGERGTIAVYADAQGALFAALTTRDGDPLAATTLPPQGAFLWHELWTSDVTGAAEFYAALGQLAVSEPPAHRLGEGVEYRVLGSGEGPRAGVRNVPAADFPPLWMPYLRVDDRASLDRLLAQVEPLGGVILVPALARPAGGFMAVIAGPSGAPLALQTWSADQPQFKEL